jgi:hypothetical protein
LTFYKLPRRSNSMLAIVLILAIKMNILCYKLFIDHNSGLN